MNSKIPDSKKNKKKTKEPITKEKIDDDIVWEPEEGENDSVSKLRKRLKEAVSEKQEYMEGWQRAKADIINARKRDENDKQSFARYANESLITDIIPTLDSFEMAFKDKEAWEKVDKNWRTGVEHILNQLKGALSNHGFKELNPIGEEFNPNLHDAVETMATKEKKDNQKIVEVIQKGYMIGEKAIRVPKVIVAEYKDN